MLRVPTVIRYGHSNGRSLSRWAIARGVGGGQISCCRGVRGGHSGVSVVAVHFAQMGAPRSPTASPSPALAWAVELADSGAGSGKRCGLDGVCSRKGLTVLPQSDGVSQTSVNSVPQCLGPIVSWVLHYQSAFSPYNLFEAELTECRQPLQSLMQVVVVVVWGWRWAMPKRTPQL